MSVTFNSTGTLLYALRRRLPPVLFKLHQSQAFCQFDAENYVNLCTMKAGCFVGDNDQVVLLSAWDLRLDLIFFQVHCFGLGRFQCLHLANTEHG